MSEYNKESEASRRLDEALEKNSTDLTKTPEVTTKDSMTEENSQVNGYTPKDEWEEKAIKIGWDPNKTGDYAVDAREYVLRKPLFERIERQSSELRNLKESQRKVDQHLAQVRKEGYEQALRDLESRRDSAIDNADSLEARRLDTEARRIHQQMQSDPIMNQPAQTPDVAPEALDFAQRNSSWFNDTTIENAKMKAAAEAYDKYLAREAQIDGREIDPKQHIAAIEAEIKNRFGHRFEQTKQTAPVQSVGKSTAPVQTFKSMTNLVSQLSPEQEQMGRHFMKSNPEYTLEKYAQDLASMGTLGKRAK